MSSRKVKINGVQTKFAFNKNKKYKYNKSGGLEEATTIADDDIVMSGSKSSLRRMADLERNISILATKLMTTDGGATDSDDNNYGRTESSNIRFKGDVRIDQELDMRDPIDMNSNRIHSLATPTSGSDAANKSYVDAREAAAESTASADATSKANAAKASAIATAAADATAKANAAQAAAVAQVVNGAPGALDTLNELAAALGDNASFSASVTNSLAGKAATGTTFTAGNGLTGGGNLSANRTFNVGGGNGITVSADGVAMSGSYTGNFTASGDITAYSDDSLKTNVQVIDGALGRVEAIRGVTFERIEDGSVSTGVIAQELEAVLPEAVKTDAEGVRHVAYGNITGLLIEAVKELSAQVAELKASK